jgi:hypothetical protein
MEFPLTCVVKLQVLNIKIIIKHGILCCSGHGGKEKNSQPLLGIKP